MNKYYLYPQNLFSPMIMARPFNWNETPWYENKWRQQRQEWGKMCSLWTRSVVMMSSQEMVRVDHHARRKHIFNIVTSKTSETEVVWDVYKLFIFLSEAATKMKWPPCIWAWLSSVCRHILNSPRMTDIFLPRSFGRWIPTFEIMRWIHSTLSRK